MATPKLTPTEAFLCGAAIHPRDKAYIEMSREHGERIGDLGTRQIKHVRFDQIGAVVTIHDKTFKGEPVRYIASTIYLRNWLEKHPFKNDPEAPLWIDMTKLPKCVPLNYDGFKAIIRRIVERHNRNAKKFNLPQIIKTSLNTCSVIMPRHAMNGKGCQGLSCANYADGHWSQDGLSNMQD